MAELFAGLVNLACHVITKHSVAGAIAIVLGQLPSPAIQVMELTQQFGAPINMAIY